MVSFFFVETADYQTISFLLDINVLIRKCVNYLPNAQKGLIKLRVSQIISIKQFLS